MWNWIYLFAEGKVAMQPELDNVFNEFRDAVKRNFSINLFAIWYDYKKPENPILSIAIKSSVEFINFYKVFDDKYSLAPSLKEDSNYRKLLTPAFNDALIKNGFSNIVYANLRIFVYNLEVIKKSRILSNTLLRTSKTLHKGLSITKVAKLKYNTVISCIKINEEQNFFVFGIMYDDRKELEKALASGILQNIKELILKNLTELDTEYHYFTPDNTRVAAFIRDQVSQYDYRDSTVEFKNLDDIIIL